MAFGRFCLHSERAVGSVTAAGGLPTHYSFLPLSGPRASPVHTYQQGSQGGWAGPALNCHLFRDNKDRLPQPLSQDAGNRASTFYVFNKFSNTLVSVAAFMGIISLGSWPPNTLFIVDWKKKSLLSQALKKNQALGLLEIFHLWENIYLAP